MEPVFFRIAVILISLATPTLAATTEGAPAGDTQCGEQNHFAPYGSFISPNYPGYYFDNSNCKYYINANSVGGSFVLIFKSFDLENPDYLRVFCATNSSFAYVTYTGKTIPDPLSIPWCKRAFVHFHTDESIARPGFSIEYHASDGGCGNTLYTGSSGHLTSPNFPEDYNNDQNCYNIIWAPRPVSFYLNFGDFFLEEFYDYVEISCWDNPAETTYRFTGTNHVPVQYTSCSEVRVVFTTDSTFTFPGFYLNYYYLEYDSENSIPPDTTGIVGK